MSLRVIIALIVILLLIVLFFIVFRSESSATKPRELAKPNKQPNPNNDANLNKPQARATYVSTNGNTDGLNSQQPLEQNEEAETVNSASNPVDNELPETPQAEPDPAETTEPPLLDEDELQQMLDEAGPELEEDLFKQVDLVEEPEAEVIAEPEPEPENKTSSVENQLPKTSIFTLAPIKIQSPEERQAAAIQPEEVVTPESLLTETETETETEDSMQAFDFIKQLDSVQLTLDLAQQYLDVGEYDSAKRLVQEVIEGQGTAEQKAFAQSLLDRLY
ncbi:FimV/HubP family polar landmark protein [Psychrobacter sp. UBA3962]|uniref:FimV/HubP family polar landmark protein n=1 Tax=Psychrobacter sp. UBA3962 TaxID=1947352 RepID=UPI0025E6F47C|nr:FimV/HubP family polar landmark protein [Psychrobacter sp. UBA3962]